MSYEVNISDQAYADVHKIFDYIAFELQSIINAERQVARIEDEILSLSEMPERYKRYEYEPWLSQNAHIVSVDNYSILYQVDRDGGEVFILRVLYAGQDIRVELEK